MGLEPTRKRRFADKAGGLFVLFCFSSWKEKRTFPQRKHHIYFFFFFFFFIVVELSCTKSLQLSEKQDFLTFW